ncbi:hypothetical protein EIP91_000085 [Steccherinum ochraceum]|uniref:Uncharacterized protein n=1 Tax=Steccherinum ochraceum TaxID=92696 RepID=A0A4R0RW07_9APHY|nr:hypothetical protein EIP91_000085 [Steccherinum ochraceum]
MDGTGRSLAKLGMSSYLGKSLVLLVSFSLQRLRQKHVPTSIPASSFSKATSLQEKQDYISTLDHGEQLAIIPFQSHSKGAARPLCPPGFGTPLSMSSGFHFKNQTWLVAIALRTFVDKYKPFPECVTMPQSELLRVDNYLKQLSISIGIDLMPEALPPPPPPPGRVCPTGLA